jgi:hypothetical protein
MQTAMSSELNMLANRLNAISEASFLRVTSLGNLAYA